MKTTIKFECRECKAELSAQIENEDQPQKVMCLECRETHFITLNIAHPESSNKTYRNEGWLHEQYITNGRSMASIAKECAVSPMTIYKWLNTHGIPTRPTGRKK